ncbi:MAG TPA: outer membrane protein transport protein [Bacteroidia bacterium]|nr:outer membrane protein transport protein [Bacteroidia bacterium]
MRLSAVLLFFLAFCRFSFAGGFQVNAQSPRQMGMGHTGTGLLTDASCLFFNPGGAAFLDHRFMVNAGTNLLFHHTEYLEPAPGIYTAYMQPHVGTPFNAYALWHGTTLSAGVGVYTPFGSLAEWPDDWKGQFLIREINLKTIFIQPTVTWKVNDYIGLGAGFVYATGGFEMRQGIPVQDANGNYGEATLNGSAGGYGFNAGLFIHISDNWSAGLSYRSSVNVKVENGDAKFTVPSSLADYFPNTTFSSAIKLPSVLNAGIGYTNDKWKFALDLNYIGWHTYDTLRIDFAEHTDKLSDIRSPRMYHDTYILRGGAQYSLNDKIQLRAGIYYDHTPVKAGYLTPETPDSDRIGVTAGASWTFLQNLSADVSFLYIEAMKRTDTNIETGFSGTYKTRVLSPGIGLNYQF